METHLNKEDCRFRTLRNREFHIIFFPFGTTAPIWALAYLHETLRFTSVY
jgi:hypothetical protein